MRKKLAPVHFGSGFLVVGYFGGIFFHRQVVYKAGPWFYNVGNNEPDNKRKRGNDLEIQNGFTTYTAYLFHVVHIGNAQHYGTKNNRRYKQLDEIDKLVAYQFGCGCKPGKKYPHNYTKYNGYKYLKCEVGK